MNHTAYLIAAAAIIAGCSQKDNFDATGTFEAVTVTVCAETVGTITDFCAEEGAAVRQGETVCCIDSSALILQRRILEQQQRALLSGKPDVQKQLESLKEQIAKQKTEQTRVSTLLKDDAATPKQLDDVDAQLKVLESQYEATLSQLSKSSASIDGNAAVVQAQMDQVDYNIGKCNVTAPSDGVILAQYVRCGELAATGKPLFKIGDINNMILRAYFTSDQIPHIALGQQVNVIADFGGDQRYEYPGTITWISSESEFTPKNIQTRNSRSNLVYAVKITVKNDGRLKIGTYAEVVL